MRRFVIPFVLALGAIAPVSAQQPPPSAPPPPQSPELQALSMLRQQALDREKAISEAAFALKAQSDALQKQVEDLQKQLEAAKAAATPKVATVEAPK